MGCDGNTDIEQSNPLGSDFPEEVTFELRFDIRE